MKYKLIGRNDFFMPVETILDNRSISRELFDLDKTVIEDYNNYDNMQEGINLLISHINNKGKIVIVGDCDVDGATSFAILYNRLKDTYKDIDLHLKIHKGKEHGLSNDIIIEDDVSLVIVIDAGSNDYKQHKQLKDRGIDVLVIDHHECDKGYSKHAIVINNQLSKKVYNKNLSGAGVVYKFIKALDDYLFENKSEQYIDLVALGNIADVMDLHEKETRYYVYRGIEVINNTFIKALVEQNKFDLEDKYNVEKVGWVIAPKLNGTIRSGTQEEKLKMFQAFVSDDYDFCLETAKMCKNIKSRQDNAVKSGMAKIIKDIELNKDDKCLILEVGDKLNQSHTGLVAMKLSDKYKLPTLLYRDIKDKDGFVGGSFRGVDGFTDDLRMDILNSNLVEFSQGHPQAGGYQLKKQNIPNLKRYLDDLYKNIENIDNKEYRVDFILSENDIDDYVINQLASLESEFGNGIDVPLIAFEDIKLELNKDINLKGKLNIVFYINGVKFIKKFSTNILKESLLDKNVTVNFIGKCSMNTYNNTGQVEIVDIEVKE